MSGFGSRASGFDNPPTADARLPTAT